MSSKAMPNWHPGSPDSQWLRVEGFPLCEGECDAAALEAAAGGSSSAGGRPQNGGWSASSSQGSIYSALLRKAD
jgi:hypothetical protein